MFKLNKLNDLVLKSLLVSVAGIISGFFLGAFIAFVHTLFGMLQATGGDWKMAFFREVMDFTVLGMCSGAIIGAILGGCMAMKEMKSTK